VDGTGPGSCPVAGFGISSVESWGSATLVSCSKRQGRCSSLYLTTGPVTS
jgi:hypothetical protein